MKPHYNMDRMAAYDVVVAGAGVFGAWTAWHLGRAGKRVLLVDAWGPGHSRASSGGESRAIRMGYGADEIYTRMSMRSMGMWRELFNRIGQKLFHQAGVLWIAREGDAYSEATRETLERVGLKHEILSNAKIAARYPQIRVTDSRAFGIFEADSGALMARRAVEAVVEDAKRFGVEYTTRAIRAPSDEAETWVFACGPWLPKTFPELLGNRIFPTRQEVFFFAPPAGDKRFTAAELPVWLDFTDPRGPYGFPDLESRGFKLAFDQHGEEFDPDNGDRRVGEASVAKAREYLAERFPALSDAVLTETRVCQYENTSNGDFMIDRHPDFENVWIAGGGSGHGFKHGPAVGEYTAGRILGTVTAEPRFALSSKQQTQCRTVF